MERREFFAVAGVALVGAAISPSLLVSASPFDLYVAEIDILAEQCGAVDQGKSYCVLTGTECWREMFDDGLSPARAWQEECWAAAEMLG